MLELRSVSAGYGQAQVLWDVSLTVGEGELVCLLGGNASGKSTTIKTIIGLVHPMAGEILWVGRPIQRRTPVEVVRAGIAPVLKSALQAVLKHRPIRLPHDIEANLDDAIRLDTQDVAIVSRVVQLAKRKAVRHDRLAPWMTVGKDVRRLE